MPDSAAHRVLVDGSASTAEYSIRTDGGGPYVVIEFKNNDEMWTFLERLPRTDTPFRVDEVIAEDD